MIISLKEKKELEISQENKAIKKKIYDLSFNIPSFNDQKAFNNFRKKSKKHNFIFEKNFPGLTLSNKFNQIELNNLKIFTPIFKANTITKQSLKQYLQQNLNEKNKNAKIIQKKEEPDNNEINNEVKNINIININQNVIGEEKNEEKNNNLMYRLNTDTNHYLSNNKIKFPELNQKLISNNNNNNKEINLELSKNNNFNNNTYISTFTKNKNKRLTSAKPLTLRPLTSKLTKNIISFNNKIKFNKDTFSNNTNIINAKTKMISESNRNYSENKAKKTYRPMTGFHPQINNNVMNININFYNIDMNKRFLIPGMNPYIQENEIINKKNKLDDNDSLVETKKFNNNTNIISDIDLDKYKNSNEFLFQKIIKSIQEINGNNKRLTIKDLV